jgi:hypothetical protein
MQSEQIFEAKGCCSRLIAPAMTTLKSFIARNLWKQEQHHPNMANFFDWSSFSCTNDFVTRVHILVIEGNCCHQVSEISTIGSKYMAYDENRLLSTVLYNILQTQTASLLLHFFVTP